MSNAPCRGCQSRNVTLEYNCHNHCEKYKAAVEDNAARKAYKESNKAPHRNIRTRNKSGQLVERGRIGWQ